MNNKKYLKIFITAIPYQNNANEAIIQLLSTTLSVPKSYITIKTGKTSKTKIVYVNNIHDRNIVFLKK